MTPVTAKSRRGAYSQAERAAGRPMRVPYGPAKEHLDKLRAMGMTDTAVAAEATANGFPMHQSTVTQLGRKFPNIHRDTEAGILSVPLDDSLACDGKLVDICGAQRAIGALMLKGYSLNWLSQQGYIYADAGHAGGCNGSHAFRVIEGRYKTTTMGTFRRTYAAAQKLEESDPLDLGMALHAVSRSKNYAARNGFVPLSCWDHDTILDPEAVPEWTGACGTWDGYRIHIRESYFGGTEIPLCEACRQAVETRPAEPDRFVWKPKAFAEQVDSSGTSLKRLADVLGMDSDAGLHRWRGGEYGPKYRSTVERLAEALDCDVSDLIDEGWRSQQKKLEPVKPGEFNPYAARIVLELAETAQAKAADLIGVSHGTMNNWLNRRTVPASPAAVQKLAEQMGVAVEAFYG